MTLRSIYRAIMSFLVEWRTCLASQSVALFHFPVIELSLDVRLGIHLYWMVPNGHMQILGIKCKPFSLWIITWSCISIILQYILCFPLYPSKKQLQLGNIFPRKRWPKKTYNSSRNNSTMIHFFWTELFCGCQQNKQIYVTKSFHA